MGKGRRAWNYLHRKSRCEMLIGGDDICMKSLPRVFQCLFTVALFGGNLTAQPTGSHRGIGGGI